MKDHNLLFYDTLPDFKNEQTYTVSFWMDNFTEDLYPRSRCAVECFNDSSSVPYNRTEFGMWQGFRALTGNNALIEFPIKIGSKKDRLAVTVWHYEIYDDKSMFGARELLIKPLNDTLYKVIDEHTVWCNNRVYKDQ